LFTGIVEEVCSVALIEAKKLAVNASLVMEGLKLGDSVSINGTCLTVVERTPVGQTPGRFAVDLSPETLRRTSLGDLGVGGPVNLERALAAGDRMGGHIVQGHVDGTGRLTSLRPEDDCLLLRVRAPKRLMPYIVEKGFIAVDGVSLTVVKKGASSFTLSVIPYTLQNTNLGSVSAGDRVNLEADILAKYVESLLSGQRGS
jgi:riboflavin synthase